MAQFTFTDSTERTYPAVVVGGAMLVAQPGETYDLPADPGDGRWSAVTSSQTPLEAPQTAATPQADPTTTPTN